MAGRQGKLAVAAGVRFDVAPGPGSVAANWSFVGSRLQATRGIVQVPVDSIEMVVLRDFLNADECHQLVALIDADRRPSSLFAEHPDRSFRTSETCNLDPRNELVRRVEERLSALCAIDRRHGEFLQGQRYVEGQRFKPHHDFLQPDQPYWKRQKDIGGQRTWTLMVYLTVPAEGGETYFPRARVLIPPRQGKLVAWNNLDARGDPNPRTLHESLPVVRGTKYIITKWYRDRPWGMHREKYR